VIRKGKNSNILLFISYTDVKQGQLGDCYFLAALAAIATKPDNILNTCNGNTEIIDDKIV
jgi:hypothetical protein